MPSGTSLAGKWWFTLDEFLDRAERVLTSEFARRQDLATVGSTMKLIASLSEHAEFSGWRVAQEHPPEAKVESAAARVRPLFLEDDPVFHGRVTNALGGLAQTAPDTSRAAIKALKQSWRGHDDNYRWAMATSRGVAPNPDGSRMRTDRQIARDFIYGDLVHADPEARQRIRHVPPGQRLLAATVWVADATRLTLVTKQLMIDLRDAGWLTARP